MNTVFDCLYHNFKLDINLSLLIFLFHSSMDICQFCKKICSGDRGLSLHMYHSKECFQKLTNMTKQLQHFSLMHSQNHSSPQTEEQEHARQNKKIKLNDSSDDIDLNTHFLHNNDFNNSSKSHLETSITSTPLIDSSLMIQQTEYNNKIKNTMIMNHNLAEIDLLKILHDLKCSNSAYNTIMSWASRWNSNNVHFDSSSSYKFKNRDQLLNDLSLRYDMMNMKPVQHDLQLQNSTMDTEITTKVSCFDFKQQLLSILRDDNIMNPNNLVFKNEPGEDPDFSSDKLKHIHDAEWYKSAYHYYNDKYGYDKNRIICGVIFAIDKTHTDQKGKLCLESVNFSLSIFNAKVRRSNYKAWRSLGFINDLSVSFGTGIENDVDMTMVSFILTMALCM